MRKWLIRFVCKRIFGMVELEVTTVGEKYIAFADIPKAKPRREYLAMMESDACG